jgi:hypothetical protein
MQIQEMGHIDRAVANAASARVDGASDTIARERNEA